MNDEYKVLEFKNKESEHTYTLQENGSYKANIHFSTEYIYGVLMGGFNSVRSGHISITKVLKTNGDTLEIGSKINNTKAKGPFIIKSFELKGLDDRISINISKGFLSIENSFLENPKPKEPIQQEIKFKEPIDGYTLEEIETVLLKALDKPEVDAIIIDFKRLKTNNDTVKPEEFKVTLKHEESYNEDYYTGNLKSLIDFSGKSYPKALYYMDDKGTPYNSVPWTDKIEYDAAKRVESDLRKIKQVMMSKLIDESNDIPF